MLRWVAKRAAPRAGVGLLVAGTLPLWLPAAPTSRVWALTAVALAAPFLVLGRDARRRADGSRAALRAAPRAGRLVLVELVPPLIVVLAAAWVGTGFALRASLALAAWALALVTAADALDRGAARPGAAWAPLWLGVVALVSAPLWAAAWFGTTGWAPWPATLVMGLHPASVVLAASDLSTLQDPLLYTVTLSGVVEVRPLPWYWGTSFFALAALAGAGLSVRAIRRPPRSI